MNAADDIGGAASAPEGRRRRFRALQLLAVVLVAALLGLLGWRVVDQGRGDQLVSDIRANTRPAAPGFALKVVWPRAETWPSELRAALADGKVTIEELRGYPVVLNFWASWCGPCKEEAPRFAASAREHAGRVVFLGVDVQDFESDAKGFLRRYDLNYVSVRDGGTSTFEAYGLTGLPETYYIDAGGRIVAHDAGAVSGDELAEGVALVLEEGA